ncbi:MAG: hypothetical protein LBI20_03320 [Holosporales bacterium]|jgi:hypothetical protein|nr:hypothetical protein [Holosporales bacterium]
MNISRLSSYRRHSDFIRVTIFDNSLRLQLIKDGKIIKKIQSNLLAFDSIINYMLENPKTPIEIVISNKSISCKSIPSKLSGADLKNFARWNLKPDTINTVFYENKFLNKRKSLAICHSLLSSQIIFILQQLLNLGNDILGIVCWPIWLISSYFNIFPEDRNKFRTTFFTVEIDENWEIIAIHEGNFVCYRNVLNDNFDKIAEIDSTIKYVAQICKINPEDIAIYTINENTITDFTKKSTEYMSIVSSEIDYNCIKLSRYLECTINALCFIFFIIVPYKIISETIDTITITGKINEARNTMNTIDPSVSHQLDFWMAVDGHYLDQPVNFRGALKKYVETTEVKFLQKASLKLDETSNKIIVNAVEALNIDTSDCSR